MKITELYFNKDEAKMIELHDGKGDTGGIAFIGETLDDFLTEQEQCGNDGYSLSAAEINKVLKQCGIRGLAINTGFKTCVGTMFSVDGQYFCRNGNSVMVNATEMAKQFGKLPHEWLRLPSTKEFLDALTNERKSLNADFQAVITKKGGLNPNNGGTWMHEDAALEFARWLSPKFAIWCNDRIKELLKTGVATVTNDDEAILNAINILNKRIEESKRKLEIAQNQIALQAPKVEHYNALVDRNGLTNLRDTAKAIGINPKAFVNLLLENRFIYRDKKNTLKPYAQYIDLFELKEWKSNDNKKTGIQTLVNQKGREKFLKYFNK